MERLGFVHLSGPRTGASDWLSRLPATIGSGPDADLVVPGTAPRHAVLFHRDGDVILLDSGSEEGTWMGVAPVQETALRDGDVVTLGRDGPRLRFQRGTDGAALGGGIVLPAPNPSQTLVLRALAQSSSAFRRAMVALALFASALFAWGFVENRRVTAELQRLRAEVRRVESERALFERRISTERRRAEDERRLLERRLEDERRRADELRSRLGAAAAGDVQSLKEELDTTRRRIATLESERAAGEQIIRQYGGGVCLIQGAYAFHDAKDRPLRYRGEPPAEESAEEDLVLSPDGEGPLHSVEYYGTGFLVRSSGLILTNRHVAEPWWNDATAAEMQKQGYQARLLYLRAFFPRRSEPYELVLFRTSEVVDLALLRTTASMRAIPVLPLESSPMRTQAGQPVVVVGYPTGLEAILAKADGTVVRDILESHGTDSAKVTLALARQGLIRPSTTQGHIGDITRSDIVFDAPSAQGGSGGPVFNKHGQVIAVEYAVLQKFGGNAFGIPIQYALDLLRGSAGSRGE